MWWFSTLLRGYISETVQDIELMSQLVTLLSHIRISMTLNNLERTKTHL